ncbi:uncharacterized protein LOC143227818 isoform X3 [Tachypleus tridentatus]|uniref:uncharacterized protein LOC143227818 isoform X3 n=1 Tax=Tachypleus tridentatus TaxID=6853 RepID=UPI003FD2999A
MMKCWLVTGVLVILGCKVLGILGGAINNEVVAFICPEKAGYYSRPENCSTFYKCKNWQVTEETCYPKTVYNSLITNCDWPKSTKCEKGKPKGFAAFPWRVEAFEKTSLITCPDKLFCLYSTWFSCSQYFRCADGIAYLVNCSKDMYFDLERGICGPKEYVECDITTTEAYKPTTSQVRKTTPNVVVPTLPPEPICFRCPEPCGLFPDPKDCKRFYFCYTGLSFRKECPSGLHFNAFLQTCDKPGEAGCGKEVISTIRPASNQTCSNDCSMIRDTNDCTKYKFCKDNKIYEMTCPPGLAFNPKTDTCDYADKVECRDPRCPEPNGFFLHPDSCLKYLKCENWQLKIMKCPEGLGFNPNTMRCNWPDTCDEKVIKPLIVYPAKKECPCYCCAIADPNDCSKFTLCINGHAIEEKCSDGLLFNPKSENCDYAKNVNCDRTCDRDCDDKPTVPPGNHCKKPSGFFPYPTKCNLFIHCSNTIPDIKECPSILHFNPRYRVCDWPWNTGCGSNTTEPEPEPEIPDDKVTCDCDCCFLPVKGNCAAYIRCEGGVAYRGKCPGSLVFNKDVENCDLPENVICEDKPKDPNYNCTSEFGLFPYPNDCEKFIQCYHWIPHVRNCLDKLHFNPSIKVCDWPNKDGCDGIVPTKPSKPDGTCDLCECCFIPDDKDCSAFTRCENGKSYKDRCSPGLLFNPKTENCDYEDNVDCEKPNVYTTTTVQETTTVSRVISTVPPTLPPEPICFRCPEQCGLFPDPKDCKRFYFCYTGLSFRKECPSGLHFNAFLQTCDKPGEAGCGKTVSTTMRPASNQTCSNDCSMIRDTNDCFKYKFCKDKKIYEMTCPPDLAFNPKTDTCDDADKVDCRDPRCPEPNGFFPHPDSCLKYLKCENWQLKIMKCPEGLGFNPNTRCCNWPDTCDEVKRPLIVYPAKKECPCYCCAIADPNDCSKFILCVNGHALEQKCSDGLLFNPKSENCDYAKNVNCDRTCDKDCDDKPTVPPGNHCKKPSGLFPHPTKCNLFIHCSNNIPDIKECPSILHFNPRLRVCDWPWIAGCGNNTNITRPDPEPEIPDDKVTCDCDCCFLPVKGDCAAYIRCEGGIAYHGRCRGNLLFNRDVENCDLPENVICEDKPKDPNCNCTSEFGLFPHPKDCGKFIQCSHWIPHVRNCPDKLHFNPSIKVCDWPNKDGCDGIVPTKPSKPDGTCDLCECCFIPDDKDCAAFTRCENGKSYKDRCSPGLLFNPKTENCDYEDNVDCEKPKVYTTTTVQETTTVSRVISTVPPTLPPEPICFRCPEQCGLFPDPKDCKRFYFCYTGLSFRKECPSGLHFNAFRQTCDKPVEAGCGKTVSTTMRPASNQTCSNGCSMIRDTNDCTKYKFCKDNKIYEMTCPPGLAFNPKTDTCDYADKVDCRDPRCPEPNGFFPHPDSCLKYLKCENWQLKIMKCPEGLGFNPNTRCCNWPDTCDEEVKRPLIVYPAKKECPCYCCAIADPNDCRKFILCVNGHALEQKCSDGLLFNPKSENCDYAKNVNCDRTCDKDCDDKPTVPPGNHCKKPSGLFPHPTKCNLFIHCSNNIPDIKECPSILHFNPRLRVCDWPWIAGCGNNTNITKPDPEPEIPDDKVTCDCDCCFLPVKGDCAAYIRCEGGIAYHGRCRGNLLFNRDVENCDLPENVLCEDKPKDPNYNCTSEFGLFPHPKDCGKFIQCSHWIPHVMNCPSKLHFNPAIKVCDWPNKDGCDGIIPTKPPKPDGICDLCECCFIPDDKDCAAFTRCENGKSYKERCPSGLLFNPSIENCDFEENVDCEKTGTCPEPCGIFPYQDCAKFMHCDNNFATIKDCPAGLHFNPTLKSCDLPERAGCERDRDPNPVCNECDCCLMEDKEDCSRYYVCEAGRSYHAKCGEGLLFEPSLKNCVLEKDATCKINKFVCPTPNGMFKNDENCSTFWICSNGIGTLHNCPAGLHWSHVLKRCEWPCVAQCDSSIPVCPTSTTSAEPTTKDPICPCPECISLNPFDCQSYFKCKNGLRVKMYCPEDLYFNQETKMCDQLYNVECPNVGDPTLCKMPNGKFIFPGDCNKYVECINGIAFIRQCKWEQRFDELRKTCISDNGGCEKVGKDPVCKKVNGLFAKKDDCSQFYHCSNGFSYVKNCPASLFFNPRLKVCDWPWNVNDCGVDPVPDPDPICEVNPNIKCPSCACRVPDPHDCGTFYECTVDGRTCKKICPAGLKFNAIKMMCDRPENYDCTVIERGPPENEISTIIPKPADPCARRSFGLVRSPSDCSKYINCGAVSRAEQMCPSGLYFNEAIQVCDFPYNVQC